MSSASQKEFLYQYLIEMQYTCTCLLLLVVLNEKQRIAKRKLIEENRERRKRETMQGCTLSEPSCSKSETSSVGSSIEALTQADNTLISAIVQAFEKSSANMPESPVSPFYFSQTHQ